MHETREKMYWVISIMAPLLMIVNIVGIIILVRLKETKKHLPIVSLCILNVLYSVNSFVYYQYMNRLRKSEDSDTRHVTLDIIIGADLPVGICYLLHMMVFIITQVLEIGYGFRPDDLHRKHTGKLLILAICVWMFSFITLFFYFAFEVHEVYRIYVKYILLTGNAIYFLSFVVTHIHIYRTFKKRSRSLRRSNSSESMAPKDKTAKRIKMYLIFHINYIVFALTPMVVSSVAYLLSKDASINGTLEFVVQIFIQIWVLSSPLTLFYCYYAKSLRALLKRKQGQYAVHSLQERIDSQLRRQRNNPPKSETGEKHTISTKL